MKKKLAVLALILLLAVPAWGAINGLLEFTSCAAVTSTGFCPSGQLSNLEPRYTYTVIVTGAPSVVVLELEGSLDDVEFFLMDTSNTTTREMRHVINRSVHFLRGSLVTLTGGTAPTVTVKISARS
ncbi:hypothetical protein IIA15_00410 [candidate division TA06 bacterium]|nr:hypothetical protein [candidate division TA06 bacterium]